MQAVREFERVVNGVYGVYLDAVRGFSLVKKAMEQSQIQTIRQLKQKSPKYANLEHLDKALMVYGEGDPNTPDAIELHRCTQAEYKNRNSPNGLNYQFIGNMGLIALYQYWEDNYRAIIARDLGKTKNDLQVPIMGDLRILRHSIIHHNGIALADVKQCQILSWYSEGDEIFIDEEKFKTIIYHIKKWITEVNEP